VARKYLESRHVTMEQAQVGGLGFGPRGTGFLDAMKGLGLREEVLLEAGLVVNGMMARRLRVSEVGCFFQFMTCVREWLRLVKGFG